MAETRGYDDDDTSDMETRERSKTRRNPSIISLAMGRTASKPAGVSSMDAKKLIPALYQGVLLDDDKVKFWVEEKLQKNCFMILAKAFYIKWGDDQRHWSWIPCEEDCFGGPVEVGAARLKEVGHLEVSCKLPSIMLSPRTTYEVVFVLKLTKDTGEWNMPTTFGLRLPNRPTQNRLEDLGEKPKEEWLEILVGDFVATRDTVGYIDVSLKDLNFAYSKAGMAVKGIIFRSRY